MAVTKPSNPPAHPNWVPKPIVTPWDDLLDGIRSPVDWQAKRGVIMERFRSLLRDEAAPPRPGVLDIRVEQDWAAEDYRIRRISYNVEADERAPAYLAVPNGPAPAGGFPAVLCVHGTTDWGARQTLALPPLPGDGHQTRTQGGKDYARSLVRRGFVTLSPEHFCCATRRPAEGPYDTAAFYRKHPNWSAVGKSTFENQVALDVLCSLPEVNAGRLGVTGHSLGGANTVFLSAIDDRIRCAASSCAGLTFNENPDPLQWSRDHWYIYIPQLREQFLRGERIACDYHEMMALTAPRPMLEVFALNDADAASQAQRVLLHLKLSELWRLLGREPAHAFLVFGDGHLLTDLTTGAIVTWMERWLKHDGNPIGGWTPPPTLA